MFLDANGGRAVETLRLPAAYCVAYYEQFASGDAAGGAYQCFLTLSDPTGWTIAPGGPAGAFVALAAREHGVPGAALLTAAAAPSAWREMGICGAMGAPASVAAPFVMDADGVPRLHLIVGDPPFIVKSPKKGKPGLDRKQFERQLTAQQDGLNKLTVAAFIANRDQYIALSEENKRLKKKGGGRDPKGDAAQQLKRKEALEDKIEELQGANPNLTEEEAIKQANAWITTQAALHDPDQVAGGHSHIVTGMGDSRVNSSIGAQWPSHIKAIDKQIREYAKHMTQEQMKDVLLDISLPIM